jgi:hypothetical protein
MVGGAPGEDVQTYLDNCPHLSFIGVNSYFCAEWRADNSCARESEATVEELREPLERYHVGRNLPAITEINSGKTPVTARLAYIAVAEFGVPIYAPWALTVSYPEPYEPYILPDGREANGAEALRETYESLREALPQISYYAGSDKLRVFMSETPGERFSRTDEVNGAKVTVQGEHNGQAIVIHPSGHEFLMIGFRCGVSLNDAAFEWPALKNVRVRRVKWSGNDWVDDGAPSYGVDQSHNTLDVDLDAPQAVLVSW